MSKGKYSVVEISPAEIKRQQEEQKRRLEEERRRLEEARRKEIERRRQEEVAAEKERLALAKSVREKAVMLSPQPIKKENKTLPPGRERTDLSATKAAMQAQAQVMRQQLAAIPNWWTEYFAARLTPVREIITKVEASNFDTYYYHQLKEAGRNLATLVATAENELENMFRRLKECKEAAEKLLIEMTLVADTALLDEQRRQAHTISAALRSLLKQPHLDLVETPLQNLRRAGQQLWEDYTSNQEKAQQQQFLLHNAQAVLAEMGYQALSLDVSPPNPAAAEQGRENTLYFRTPGLGLIEMSFDQESSFAANYLLPRRAAAPAEETLTEEIIADCHNWCQDYDIFVQRLSQRKIYLHEKGRQQTREGHFKEIIVPDTFFADEEPFAPWTKQEEKSRRF